MSATSVSWSSVIFVLFLGLNSFCVRATDAGRVQERSAVDPRAPFYDGAITEGEMCGDSDDWSRGPGNCILQNDKVADYKTSVDGAYIEPVGVQGPTAVVVLKAGTRLTTTESPSALPRRQSPEVGRARRWRFAIVRGKSIPVCEAFLQRLNSTRYEKPPTCELPEDDSIRGFSKLTRKMLTKDEVAQLWSHVYWFTNIQNQAGNSPDWPSSIATNSLGRSLLAWRYDPAISVDNDNHPSNVVIWQGAGVSGGEVGRWACGEKAYFGGKDIEFQSNQYGFILSPDSLEIDADKTRSVFGDPASQPPPAPFRPLGDQIGLVQYEGIIYIYAFRPDGEGLGGNRRQITSTLTLFRRTHHAARRICEYDMSRNDSNYAPVADNRILGKVDSRPPQLPEQ